MIIDSHCHLTFKNETSKLEDVLERAKKVGVGKFLNIATQYNEFDTLKSISEKYNDIYFTLGIHPHESSQTNNTIIDYIKDSSSDKKMLGIGETGLDYYYNHVDKKTQLKSLELHIEISQETRLPLIIHMRDAEEDLINLFSKKYKDKAFSGVIHCFTGSLKFALNVIEMGFYISASGIITFKNSDALREVFKQIPINKTLVETDSPYLAPTPNRGKTNEPSYIIHTLNKLTEIHKINYGELCEITSNNFAKLFKI